MRRPSWLAYVILMLVPHAWSQPALVSPTYYLTTAPEVLPGETLEGELAAADGQNFKDGSRVDVWVLRPRGREALALEVRSDAFDPYLTVYAPDGTVVAAVDDSPDSLNPSLTFRPQRQGPHLVVVSGVGSGDLGAYRLAAQRLSARAAEELPLARPVRSMLSATDPPDPEVGSGPSRSFSLELEQAVLLRLRASSDDFDTVLALFSDHGWLDENDDAGGSTDSELWVEVEAGSYRVTVSSYGAGGSGGFTLSAEAFVPVE